MPKRSRASSSLLLRESQMAIANIPRSGSTNAGPRSSYRWTSTSVSLCVLKA